MRVGLETISRFSSAVKGNREDSDGLRLWLVGDGDCRSSLHKFGSLVLCWVWARLTAFVKDRRASKSYCDIISRPQRVMSPVHIGPSVMISLIFTSEK